MEHRRTADEFPSFAVDDPFELTCEYMIGEGLLLKIDGKWYAYQNSDAAYYGWKQQNSGEEVLSDD